MTTALEGSPGDPSGARSSTPPTRGARPGAAARAWAVEHPVAPTALLTMLLRLPAVARAPGADEAGYLTVAQQWHPGGSSLYGDYWVDRPPLLITIFRAAALAGGLDPLRLIGCVAAGLTVVGVAHVAGRVAAHEGYRARTAAGWAAVVGAAWCLSPQTGAAEVNGELLAAPFVVWGIAATLAAVWTAAGGSRRAWRCAAAAGIAAVAAAAVKQNFLDVAVFAGAFVLVGLARHELSWSVVVRVAAGFVTGGLALGAALCTWTLLHGTSLGGVFYAMYPFRMAAGHVIATSGSAAASVRLSQLALGWTLSGMALVTLLVLGSMIATKGARSTAQVSLALLVAFDTVSILLGGGFWPHYLVQLIGPLAVLAGISAARRTPGARPAGAALTVVAALSVATSGALLPGVGVTDGSSLGHAVGAAARRGDTIVTLYGHSDVTQQSGLSSPYPYLWSLPVKTLDPGLHELDGVLTGPRAPTWVVTWADVTSWGVDSDATSAILSRDYHVAAVLHGHTVYLRDGLHRPPPVADGTDRGAVSH